MNRNDELIGKKIGRLTVQSRDSNKSGYFLCDCDCGTRLKSINGFSLKKGLTLSCGCYNREVAKSRMNDISGQKFGLLTAIRRDDSKEKSYWLCNCNCGNTEVSIATYDLVHGKRVDCGCKKRNELNGYRTGMLTVIERTDKRSSNGDYYYRCKCDYGKETLVIRSNLLSKTKYKTISCGCYTKSGKHVEDRKDSDREFHICKNLYGKLKRRHKKYNSSAEAIIPFGHFCKMIKQPCYYCGCENSDTTLDTLIYKSVNGVKQKGTPTTDYVFYHNGIDRIDSNIGYTQSNCVPCCKFCNMAKSDRTIEEFWAWSERVYNYYIIENH